MATLTLSATKKDAHARIDRFLLKHVPGMGPELAAEMLETGRVRIRGKVCSPGRVLWGNETIELEKPPPLRLPAVSGPQLPVLFEDDALLVIDKPVGLAVERDESTDNPLSHATPSVVALAATQRSGFDVAFRAEPGVAHRLDRETSGCLALAKTDDDLASLLRAFVQKQVHKRYFALVLGAPPDRQHLEGPYSRDPENPRRYTTRYESPRRAALSFEVRERFADVALLDVALETGRTHQIRVQLSEAGFPVLGDKLYGTPAALSHPAAIALGRQALHARSLALPHPRTGAPLSFEAPLPEDFERALALLRGSGTKPA
jgi:23S rRNA pseudouridine1911/1915/1917 synthase